MSEAPQRLDRLLVLGLWLAYVLAASNTTIATDTARDLISAWDIVQGRHFPLRGPELYATWTLGPIWYYLLAIPLWLTHSAAFTAVVVAMLAGLKFPLMYRLGTEFGDRQLARLGVLAIAVPGWWLFEWLVTSHTNLAASCLIAYALSLLRWAREGRAVALLVAALLLSLAVHAHPTSVFWAWLLLPALRSQRSLQPKRLWPQMLAAGLVFLLPFLPMLIAEAQSGWPMLVGTRQFVATREAASSLSRIVPLLIDLIAIDTQRMVGQFLPKHSVLVPGTIAAMALLWIFAIFGVVAGRNHVGLRAMAFATPIAGSLFLISLRPETPYWMVYALSPALAALLALGWHSTLNRVSGKPRLIFTLLACCALTSFFGAAGSRWTGADKGWVRVPYRVAGRFADPNKRVDAELPNADYAVAGQENWVRWLCAQSQPISLHGDGAAMQRMTQGVLRELHCRDDRHWQIGGIAAQPMALYAQHALEEVGVKPLRRFGAMGEVAVAAVLRPAERQTDELVRAYPPWPLTQQAGAEVKLAFPELGPGVIAVSNLRVVFNGLERPRLQVDGTAIDPLARTASTWFFRLPVAGQGVLSLRAGDTRWIEVLALEG